MDDLTLDVCVLMTGSGIGDPQYENACRDLMKRMLAINNYKLALDKKGQIKHQYLINNREGTFGHHFVIRMALKGKIVVIPGCNLSNAIRTELEQKGFTRNDEDYKYVICASGTCCNKLVSHEPHFFNVSHILRKIPVNTLWPNQA